jgi:hypothetical protein
MRAIAVALSAVVVLAGACTSERVDQADRPSPPAHAQTADERPTARAQIYAAVIRQLVTRDHTFGSGPSPFEHVYVVNGAIKDPGPRRGGLGPAPEPFPSVLVDGIKKRLRDLPPVRSIIDGESARRGTEYREGSRRVA